jgi:formyltetrahydrofolate hydrolase
MVKESQGFIKQVGGVYKVTQYITYNQYLEETLKKGHFLLQKLMSVSNKLEKDQLMNTNKEVLKELERILENADGLDKNSIAILISKIYLFA